MVAISVRDARADEAARIANMQVRMALETEGLQLEPDTIAKGVQAPFDRPHLGRYFIAEIEATDQQVDGDDNSEPRQRKAAVAGSLLITYEWSDWRNGTVFWIQSVFVEPEFRRRGVFKALFAHVQHLAQLDPECSGVRLYVENENERARATYEAMGMEAEHYTMMKTMKGNF
jgi:ribosomal protein S18 acetylase RimI-like enzyme